MKRVNHRQAKNLGRGVVAWTSNRRVTAYLEPDSFDLLRTQAEDEGVGVGVVAARLLEAAVLRNGPRS